MKMTGTTLSVLNAFLEAGPDGRLYGLEIKRDAALHSGTLYPILDRLESNGWITGEWQDNEDPSKPRRRYYCLTAHGVTESHAAIERAAQPKKRRRLGTVTA